MKRKMFLMTATALLLAVRVGAAEPTMTDVTVQQQWPWSRSVSIDYVLNSTPGVHMDVAVELYNDTERLEVPEASFSGGRYGILPGPNRIVWDPTQADCAEKGVLPEFRVKLSASVAPLYLIVDLDQSAGEAGQLTPVYETELTNGQWGAWVRNPVTNRGEVVESVIWTGVTTNDTYKTDKMVFRRVFSGTFNMGAGDPPALSTTLTEDFYIGVFQVTGGQWNKIQTSPVAEPNQPRAWVQYNDMRGSTNDTPSVNWPETGSAVSASSYIGKFRAKTGLQMADLPTEAQWEYACRAETTTAFNNGITNITEAQIFELGWMKENNPVYAGRQVAGLKLPNAWGLYDMHGYANDWCLDWHAAALAGGTDPQGPPAGTSRMRRGGSRLNPGMNCSSADRYYAVPNSTGEESSVRLVITLP